MRNLYDRVAKAKYQLPEEWESYRWEAIGPFRGKAGKADIIVTGAIAPRKTRGKCKGQRNWRKLDKSSLLRIAITSEEIDDFLAAYEAATGNCHECEGSSEQWTGWSADEGSKYAPCLRCGATGRAPTKCEAA